MTREVITLSPSASVGDALEVVAQDGVRHVPIVDHGKVVGMVSDRDMRRVEGMLALQIEDPTRTAAVLDASIMSLVSGEPLMAPADASIDDLIDVFLDQRVGAIVIVDGANKLQGIVSVLDVLAAAKGRFR